MSVTVVCAEFSVDLDSLIASLTTNGAQMLIISGTFSEYAWKHHNVGFGVVFASTIVAFVGLFTRIWPASLIILAAATIWLSITLRNARIRFDETPTHDMYAEYIRMCPHTMLISCDGTAEELDAFNDVCIDTGRRIRFIFMARTNDRCEKRDRILSMNNGVDTESCDVSDGVDSVAHQIINFGRSVV